MAGRRGRPTVENPRLIKQFVRLNEEENARLNRVSQDMCMSRPETIRTLLEDYEKKMK